MSRRKARRLGFVLGAAMALSPLFWLVSRSTLVRGEEAPRSSVTAGEEARPAGTSSRAGGARDCLDESKVGSFVRVPAGAYTKGADAVYPEERDAQRVHVEGFLLQVTEVTNAEFSRFVEETHHRTTAEGGGGSAVFDPTSSTPGTNGAARWWRLDEGATWRTPEGAGSNLEGRERQPVVHVSLADARAYAAWAGARLLTEIEWEYAATLGLLEPERPESGAVGPRGEPRANIWSGEFPEHDSGVDGFAGRAPVGCFPPTRVGAYDMLGNVWEWTDTSDRPGRHVVKGGSYLCAKTHCFRYRPSARQELEDDFSAGHVGIRLARSLPANADEGASR